MRRSHCLRSFLLLIAAILQASSQASAGSHGTAVNLGRAWEAFHKAGQENKLVMLVHISGVFEDPAFT